MKMDETTNQLRVRTTTQKEVQQGNKTRQQNNHESM